MLRSSSSLPTSLQAAETATVAAWNRYLTVPMNRDERADAAATYESLADWRDLLREEAETGNVLVGASLVGGR